MSKRPESVRVIGQPFAITWIDDEEDALSAPHRLGSSNVTKQAIAISGRQGAEQQRDTLLHELIHVCFNTVGAMPNEKQQEQAILSLAPVLLDVLRDNPELTRWLVADA